MQEEIHCRTREAPMDSFCEEPFERYTVIEAMMGKPVNRSRLETALTGDSQNTGRFLHSFIHIRMRVLYVPGCLIRHSTRRSGKPTTWGRT